MNGWMDEQMNELPYFCRKYLNRSYGFRHLRYRYSFEIYRTKGKYFTYEVDRGRRVG